MDRGVTGNLLKFADDTKLFMSLKNEDSTKMLQQDLQTLCSWSQDWQMLFNETKCSVLHIGHGNPKEVYTMNNMNLAEVTEAKDLGIIIHDSLKPSAQCLQAAKKANRALGMICRTVKKKSPKIMSKLYKHLVRPHLEYAVQAWSPWLRRDIDLLESVQRRATKMITGFHDMSYQERLRRLHLPTLEARRRRGDVIETFKIMSSIEDVNAEDFFSVEAGRHPHQTRGHALKLQKQHTRLDCRKNFFVCRSVTDFNALPPPAVLANNVLQFKKNICHLYQGDRVTDRP
jgi:hypothetical protein